MVPTGRGGVELSISIKLGFALVVFVAMVGMAGCTGAAWKSVKSSSISHNVNVNGSKRIRLLLKTHHLYQVQH